MSPDIEIGRRVLKVVCIILGVFVMPGCGDERIPCELTEDCLGEPEISKAVDELLGLGVIAEPEQVVRCFRGECKKGPFCLTSWDRICSAFGNHADYWCEYIDVEYGFCRYLRNTSCRQCMGNDENLTTEPSIVDSWWSAALDERIEVFSCKAPQNPGPGECVEGTLNKKNHP